MKIKKQRKKWDTNGVVCLLLWWSIRLSNHEKVLKSTLFRGSRTVHLWQPAYENDHGNGGNPMSKVKDLEVSTASALLYAVAYWDPA